MAIPRLPTREEMHARCRVTYGHYSNIARERLKQMSNGERLAKFGNDRVDRWNAEVLEAEFLAKTEVEQEPDLDWYIGWYQQQASIPGPNGDYVKYALAGFRVGRVRYDVCPCRFQVISPVVDGDPTEWLHTWGTGPEHAAGAGQALFDAVFNEQVRKNGAISGLTSLLAVEPDVAKKQVRWTFDDASRLTGGLSRFLNLQVSGITEQNSIDLQSLLDIRFGANTLRVTRV